MANGVDCLAFKIAGLKIVAAKIGCGKQGSSTKQIAIIGMGLCPLVIEVIEAKTTPTLKMFGSQMA